MPSGFPPSRRRIRPSLPDVVLVLVTAAVLAPLTVSLLAVSSSAAPRVPDLQPPDGPDGPSASVDTRPLTAGVGSPALTRARQLAEDRAAGKRVIAEEAVRDRHRAPEHPAPPPAPPPPVPMARTGDLLLHVPATADTEAVVGFHQAGAGSAVALTPLGRTVDSHAPGFEALDGDDGHDHAVMASRGRGTALTSAVDVALPEGATVVSPVDGTVTLVSDYRLYGRHDDVMIVVRPTDHPEAAVHLYHVADAVVAEGDEVEAGVTPMAVVRTLEVTSQIDRFTGDTRPHVHLEVRPVEPE